MDPLPIFYRGDVEYERARVDRVFNLLRPQRYPVAVIEARHENDGEEQRPRPRIADNSAVIRGVNMARERDLKLAIRSGGHSWAAWG